MVPVLLRSGDRTIETYALLDSAADRCAILPSLVEKLQLEVFTSRLALTVLDKRIVADRDQVDFEVESLDGSCKFEVKKSIVSDTFSTENDKPPSNEDVEDLDYMEGQVSFVELDEDTIGLLLSVDYVWTWMLGEKLVGREDQPMAIHTRFGWCILGPCKHGRAEEVEDVSINCCKVESYQMTLEASVDRILRHDFLLREGESSHRDEVHPSLEDNRMIQMVKESLVFDKQLGHYKCGLPWKNGREAAAAKFDSKAFEAHARKRMWNTQARMMREPPRREGVTKTINGIIADGHARKVVDPSVGPGIPVCTPPIHVDTKKLPKYRVCQDGAAKVGGVCLNDELLAGPDLLNSLTGIIQRFRRHPVAVSADIKAFFHQIFVDEKDSPALRFFWFEDEELLKMALYEMLVHTFGAKSSPAISTFVLRYHGESIKDEISPEVLYAILKAFYVDDFLNSYPFVQLARQVKIGLTDALLRGGFELTKWKSTHPEVLNEEGHDAPENQKVEFSDIFDMEPTQKVLGVWYSFDGDFFALKVHDRIKVPAETRRQVLQKSASVFDPMGFFCPGILPARLIFQEATRLRLGWDDKLPENLKKEFDKWRDELVGMQDLRIPRWVATLSTTDGMAELHVFCDASQVGYGVCAYRRCIGGGGEIHVSLVFARAHVVPLEMARQAAKDEENHEGSIPRLELTSCRLGAETGVSLERDSNEVYTRKVYWTDSECVLKWLMDTTSHFKTFIKNRVAKIHRTTDLKDWKYCPSEENPADDCSRGLSPGDPKWQRFHSGPSFLWGPESQWPLNKVAAKEDEDFPELGVHPLQGEEPLKLPPEAPWVFPLVEKIEGWPGKVRRIAYFQNSVFSLVQWRMEHRRGGKFGRRCVDDLVPTLVDLQNAEDLLVREIQRRHFAKEMDALFRMKIRDPMARLELRTKSSALTPINPFLDERGLVRAGGRLGNSTTLTYDTKFPVVLPKKDVHVDSLIRLEHIRNGHAGVNHVFCVLMQRWFILGGRETVRHVIHRCVLCQLLFKQPANPKMASLPAERVDICVPFEVTGMDVFGPLRVKQGGRATHKRWVLLFTCLGCRAVHVEVLQDMSTPTTINALVRFHARRPGLRVLYSDNGTNFRGADAELKKAVEAWNNSSMVETMHLSGIEWRFGPPNCPWFGGIWERLIKSVKKHLAAVLSEEVLQLDVFTTVLVEVEGILNRRPLTYASSDVRDPTVLTPNDFLYPGVVFSSSVRVLPPVPPGGGESLRYQWKNARHLVDKFWDRWSKEYLITLHSRQKWRKSVPNLRVDQVVLLMEQTSPRDQWRMGVVESVRGDVNHVRSATVRLANGKRMERPSARLVGLEIDP